MFIDIEEMNRALSKSVSHANFNRTNIETLF